MYVGNAYPPYYPNPRKACLTFGGMDTLLQSVAGASGCDMVGNFTAAALPHTLTLTLRLELAGPGSIDAFDTASPHSRSIRWGIGAGRVDNLSRRRIMVGGDWLVGKGNNSMRKYTSSGYRFLACSPGCADSFKEDRKAGLIYGCIPPAITWEQSSIIHKFCAYCGTDQ